MKSIKQILYISALTALGLSLNSCNNNNASKKADVTEDRNKISAVINEKELDNNPESTTPLTVDLSIYHENHKCKEKFQQWFQKTLRTLNSCDSIFVLQEGIADGYRVNDDNISKLEHVGSDTRFILNQNGNSIHLPELEIVRDYIRSDLHGEDVKYLADVLIKISDKMNVEWKVESLEHQLTDEMTETIKQFKKETDCSYQYSRVKESAEIIDAYSKSIEKHILQKIENNKGRSDNISIIVETGKVHGLYLRNVFTEIKEELKSKNTKLNISNIDDECEPKINVFTPYIIDEILLSEIGDFQ